MLIFRYSHQKLRCDTGEPISNVEIQGTTPAAPDTKRWWTASYYPVDFLRDGRGVGAVVVEITERVQAEAELQESKAKLLAAQRLAKVRNWELAFQAGLDLATAPVEEMGSVGRENNCHSPEGLVVIGEEGFLPTTKLPRRQRASPYAT